MGKYRITHFSAQVTKGDPARNDPTLAMLTGFFGDIWGIQITHCVKKQKQPFQWQHWQQ